MSALVEYIPDVIAYLLAQAAANSSLGGASPPVAVIDGQAATQDVLQTAAAGLTQRLWIGSSGYVAPGQMDEAASSEQGFSFIDQGRTRDDQIDVACAAEAVSGDAVMATARTAAFAVMAAVELMLRGSPGTSPLSPGDATMGGLVRWSEVAGPVSLKQGQISQGAAVLVTFRVSAFQRLTS